MAIKISSKLKKNSSVYSGEQIIKQLQLFKLLTLDQERQGILLTLSLRTIL